MIDPRPEQEGFLVSPSFESAVLFETPKQIFERVHRVLRPRTDVPAIFVEFKNFANADSHARLDHSGLKVRISDVLEKAPSPVLEALAFILLCKLFRKSVPPHFGHRYRLYLNRKETRRQIDHVRQTRGRKAHLGAEGQVHHLEQIFEDLNQKHFGGMMVRPALGWSHLRSRTRLGHFDPSHGTIVISRIFDDPKVPKLALEYVMFHEMLHLHYPVDHSGSRRCVHTPEFKAHEKRFPLFQEAKSLLRKL